MDNVDMTAGHVRAFKDSNDGAIGRISSIGDLPASHLVWASLPASGGASPQNRLGAFGGKDLAVLEARFFASTPFASSPGQALPGKNTRLAGSYRRKQGRELRYTYSGFYGVNSEGSWWQVVVRCRRAPRGMPMGVLPGVESPGEAQIRRLVESSIESLHQVTE